MEGGYGLLGGGGRCSLPGVVTCRWASESQGSASTLKQYGMKLDRSFSHLPAEHDVFDAQEPGPEDNKLTSSNIPEEEGSLLEVGMGPQPPLATGDSLPSHIQDMPAQDHRIARSQS